MAESAVSGTENAMLCSCSPTLQPSRTRIRGHCRRWICRVLYCFVYLAQNLHFLHCKYREHIIRDFWHHGTYLWRARLIGHWARNAFSVVILLEGSLGACCIYMSSHSRRAKYIRCHLTWHVRCSSNACAEIHCCSEWLHSCLCSYAFRLSALRNFLQCRLASA